VYAPFFKLRTLFKVTWLLFLLQAFPARGQIQVPADPESTAPQPVRAPLVLVEEFTAGVLAKGEIKVGTDLDFGIMNRVMIGTDIVSNMVGAPSFQAKVALWESSSTRLSFGLRAAYLTKKTLLWGSMKDHFEELDARAIRPSLSWDKKISDRLTLHTFYAVGVGNIRAKLSDIGRRKLWAQKHPDTTYPGDVSPDGGSASSPPIGSADNVTSSKNQEAAGRDESIITQRSAQVQSIAGLAQDRFQITGEFARRSGHRVLISSRIERAEVEDLLSRTFRLTIAQHWIWDPFQFRLGGGFQYLETSGFDLDGEQIDEAGWVPATDIAFYWRF